MRARTIGGGLLALGLLAVIGCGNTIKQVDEVNVADRGALEKLAFGDYWSAKGFGGGDGTPVQKFAIASFRVEFVEERLTRPDQYNMSQFKTNFYEVKEELPAQLYDMFVARSRQRGRTIATRDEVSSAATFARYPRKEVTTALSRFDQPIASSAGQIRQIDTRSAPGLALFDPTSAAVREVDQALAEEIGAEVVVHISIRVGVWRGRALIEEGCLIQFHRGEELAVLRSSRPLASQYSVLENRGYSSNMAGEYNVDPDRYANQIELVFPPYIQLASQKIR